MGVTESVMMVHVGGCAGRSTNDNVIEVEVETSENGNFNILLCALPHARPASSSAASELVA